MSTAMKDVAATLRETALAVIALDDARKAGCSPEALDRMHADLVDTAHKAVDVAENAEAMLDRAHAAVLRAGVPKARLN